MAKATRVHSTPRLTASKIQTKKRARKADFAANTAAASLQRAEQIVELLTTCYVREGWKIDKAAAKRALAYVRKYAKDGSDPDEGRKAALDFFP